jgi:hypothetical protein
MRHIASGIFACLLGTALWACSSDPASPKVLEAEESGSGGSSTAGTGGQNNTGGTSTAGSGQGGSAQAGSAGSNTNTNTYPSGPFGQAVGDILQNMSFTGWRNPKSVNYDTATAEKVSFADFYNPDGAATKPKVLLVTTAARWCSACKAEASESMANYNYWRDKGVEFITLLFEDAANPPNPATGTDLQLWAKAYQIEYHLALDPNLQLGAFFNKDASPFNMIVDTKTMKIVYAQEGVVDTGPSNAQFKAATGN